jgi:hypothetical protein
MKWAQLIARVERFYKLADNPLPNEQVFYRVQPKGKSIHTHTSGLAYEKVPGIFAFDDPAQLFDTYTWLHVKKNINDYELIKLLGKEVERPPDSEGVVVQPKQVMERIPLKEWVESLPSSLVS